MSNKLFSSGFLRVFVPTGWNCFYGIDSEGRATPKKLHIYKDAQTEFDIFSKAGLTICYYGKDEIFLSVKNFYDSVQDLEPFVCGNYQWEGYTCTSFGYPYTMLTAMSDSATVFVMVLTENGEHKISIQDPDVRSILESIETCE